MKSPQFLRQPLLCLGSFVKMLFLILCKTLPPTVQGNDVEIAHTLHRGLGWGEAYYVWVTPSTPDCLALHILHRMMLAPVGAPLLWTSCPSVSPFWPKCCPLSEHYGRREASSTPLAEGCPLTPRDEETHSFQQSPETWKVRVLFREGSFSLLFFPRAPVQ